MKFLKTQNLKRYIETYKCYEYIKEYYSARQVKLRETTSLIEGRRCGRTEIWARTLLNDQARLARYKEELKKSKMNKQSA